MGLGLSSAGVIGGAKVSAAPAGNVQLLLHLDSLPIVDDSPFEHTFYTSSCHLGSSKGVAAAVGYDCIGTVNHFAMTDFFITPPTSNRPLSFDFYIRPGEASQAIVGVYDSSFLGIFALFLLVFEYVSFSCRISNQRTNAVIGTVSVDAWHHIRLERGVTNYWKIYIDEVLSQSYFDIQNTSGNLTVEVSSTSPATYFDEIILTYL